MRDGERFPSAGKAQRRLSRLLGTQLDRLRGSAARIVIEATDTVPERAERHEIAMGFAHLADTGKWVSILDRLRGSDQVRQTFANGQRYASCGLAGALVPVTQPLAAGNLEAAVAALDDFACLRADYPDDYVAALLLSRAHQCIGRFLRGDAAPQAAVAGAERAAAPHYAAAEKALDGFDPIEVNSPLLAEARYLLAPGLRDGGAYLSDWYEDWADLDPSNPEMLATHGRMLLPGWYGSYAEIETQARRAARRARGGLGDAAYALFWRPALEADPDALSLADARHFVASLLEHLDQTRNDELANDYACLLDRLGRAATLGPERDALNEGVRLIALDHLTTLRAPLWAGGTGAIRAALARAFAAELADGAILRQGRRGLVLVPPDAVG